MHWPKRRSHYRIQRTRITAKTRNLMVRSCRSWMWLQEQNGIYVRENVNA